MGRGHYGSATFPRCACLASPSLADPMSKNADQWLYKLCGTEFGPVTFELLAECAASGQLGPDDEICGPRGNWQRAGDIVGLIPDEPADEFVLPSIAEESTAARVVRPADAASLSTRGPSREGAIGPKSLGAKKPAKPVLAEKPVREESMQDAISSMLANAESVTSNETKTEGSIAPQRLAVPSKASVKPVKPAAVSKEAPRPNEAAVNVSAKSEPVVEKAVGRPQPTDESIDASPKFSAPVNIAAQPLRRPVSIPQSRSPRFDPDVLKKVMFGLAGCVAIGLVVFFGKPLLAGSGSGGNPIEVQWEHTRKLVQSLVAASESNDPDAMLRFRRDFPAHSQKIVSRLEETKDARNIDPVLTDAILILHLEAIPSFLAGTESSPEAKHALQRAIKGAEEAGEG